MQPLNGSPDWFVVERARGVAISEVGGVEFVAGGAAVHRSHLPILARGCDISHSLLHNVNDNVDLCARKTFDESVADRKLRAYQHEGREFAVRRRGSLIADTMRLGKTAQAVAAHDPTSGVLVVLAPLATRDVWLSWFAWRWPAETPLVASGMTYRPEAVKAAKLIFLHYDIAVGWQNIGYTLDKIGTLVIDEAHLISSRVAKRTRAANVLAFRSKRVIALTGTPLWNRPSGLWSILNIIAPGAFGTFHTFAQRYCDPQITPWGTRYDGVSNADELRARLTEIMIRRTWEDVLEELPTITRSVEVASISEAQALKIETAVEGLITSKTQRTTIGRLARFRKVVGQLKVDAAVDVTTQLTQSGEAVVVWVWHKDVGESLRKRFVADDVPVEFVSGDDTQDARETKFNAWRAQPAGVLVLTISVGQAGIDLSHAKHAVFCEQDFTPATIAQAEMRTFAATRPMSITYIVVDHEVDHRIVNALQSKCAAASEIGTPAAATAIDVILAAFSDRAEAGDLQRLADAIFSDSDDIEG